MLQGKYQELYNELIKRIPQQRLLHDALSTLAFGTDASFYRLIPKLVVRAASVDEVAYITKCCAELKIPVTFRAAGTSLSGQGVSDSVLVIATHGFTEHQVLDEGRKIELGPGIRGAQANRYLARYGRKIGPDPASIDSAMIGGIAANNASGMCCGTSENSYKTIADLKLVFADGSYLDTASKQSRLQFELGHRELLDKLEDMSKRILANGELTERIRKKYKIKNTTGYSLNAFVDYTNGYDILKHIIIGSEGTLAFIAGVTYNTVTDNKFKALSCAIYPTIKDACNAVQILKQQPVSAVELIDRASIRSVENADGVPQFLKGLSEGACGLLIEVTAENDSELNAKIETVFSSISSIATELPLEFTKDAKQMATLWKIRKEALPTIAGMRKTGTTAIIEDVCFPVPMLAEAVMTLREVFARNGYDDAVIFGHALAGNLHFMFNQDFGTQAEVERYGRFMDDVANMVVSKYDGSLKAEHGTGRNMAPYVELEWGAQAYALMKEIKVLFDPYGILNPGVILNDNKKAHISNLKPCPATDSIIDKCMECGFCEGGCVAEGLTMSPRQRVATYKEICRLQRTGEAPHIAAEMVQQYKYWGNETCATDSLCALKCPVKVDTGKMIKKLRNASHKSAGERRAVMLANNMDKVTAGLRGVLWSVNALRNIFGKELFGAMARGVRKISGGAVPLWTEYMPARANRIRTDFYAATALPKDKKVVYFPSCITRTMGTTKAYGSEQEVTRVTHELLEKAGFQVIYPQDMDKLCCGMAFSSKGYVKAGQMASDRLQAALMEASNGGEIPVLCDMSPCLYTMHVNMEGSPLKLYEPAEFLTKFVVPELEIEKTNEKIAVFAVCSAKKLGVDNMLYDLAKLLSNNVVVLESNCCGFAGDRGFTYPELNAHGLRFIKEQCSGSSAESAAASCAHNQPGCGNADTASQGPCVEGFATSRTCEIGLSYNSGITFKSIIHLLNRQSKKKQR